MYIRIAFSIELRLRVSRSLRSLANYIAAEKDYISIFHPNNPPLVLGMLVGASLRIPVVAIEAGMDTS